MPNLFKTACFFFVTGGQCQVAAAFLNQHQQISTKRILILKTHSANSFKENKFQRDIEERSRQAAKGGAGETVAGAVLGGFLLGPFGALFGAQIGAGFGANNAQNRARKEEMERLGITDEMLASAQECGLALERSMEGLTAVQDSLNTQQSFARILDKDADELYDKAKRAMETGDEEQAKKFLFDRTQTQKKLKEVLLQCVEAKKRLEQMESNVASIERRAKEVEALLQRTIAAKTTQKFSTEDLSPSAFELSTEDPLLKKFRDAGIN